MQNFEAVIFDMDGLLLDSERIAFEAFQATCEKFETGDLTPLFVRCIGVHLNQGKAILKEGLKGIVDFEAFRVDWELAYRQRTQGRPIPLKKGAVALLEQIRKFKIPMAVATSTATQSAHSKLRLAGLLNFFDIIVGGDQVTQSKPDPEIYLKAAARLRVTAAYCLALEDSTNGVRSAVAAGMTVVQIPDLVQPDEGLLRLGHIVLDNLSMVVDYPFDKKS